VKVTSPDVLTVYVPCPETVNVLSSAGVEGSKSTVEAETVPSTSVSSEVILNVTGVF
jgi:hypothetical protein